MIQALASGRRAEPGPAERAAAYSFGVTQRSEQPGWWGRDVWEQIDHYKGAVALAIQPYINFFLGANYCAYRKRKGAVRKSVPGGESKYSRDDGYEPLEDDHPVCEVLRRPGGDDGAFTLGFEMAFGTLQRLLTGQAPFWLPVNKDGKPCQLYALTAAYTQAAYSPGHPQYPQGAYRVLPAAGWGWATTALNVPALLPAEEVRLLRDINPLSRHRGMSKLQLGAKQIDLLNAIVDFQWSYFNEGCALDMVVSVPGAGPAETETIKRNLLEKHGGSRNARKLAVFGGGYGGEPGKSISAVNLAPNAKDLDFPNGRTMSLQEVMAFFGTPKVLAGYTEDSNYATYIGQFRMFRDMWLKPAFEIASDFLSKHLAEPWAEDGEELVIAAEPQIPKDEDAAAKELEFAVGQGLITVNEYRHATGRDSVPDGDLPASAYTQKVQQDVAPPPMPGMDPNAPPGAEQAAPMPGGNQLPGDSQQEMGVTDPASGNPDDSEQGTQDATLQAALAALGMGGTDAGPVAKGFDPNEARDESGKWTSGGGSGAPLDASSASHDEWIASAISPEDAAPLLSKIRAGDERSKNKGDQRPEPVLRPVVLARVPIASLPERVIQQLRETTSAERVKGYAAQKIDTPAILTALRSGDGFGVSDGGHRIMAAIARGDTHIPAFVPVGSYELLKKFGAPVQKAAVPVNDPKRRVRAEGERWTGADGKQWTKRGGEIVPAPQQTGSGAAQPAAAPGAQRYPSKFNEGITYGHEDDRDADDKALGRDIRAAAKQVKDLRAKLAQAQAKLPDNHPIVQRARAALQAATEKANAARAKADALKTGTSAAPAPQQPQTDPRQYHAEIIKRAGKNAKAFGLTPEVLAKMHPDAVKTIAAQLGVASPEEAYGKHAAAVPVSPAAKSHLQRAGEWADAMAAKHAQRVAQHLGISPQAAQKILAKAIRQVAEHALKSGGRASGTLSVGGRSLRLGVNAKPAGAVGGAKDGAGARPQPGIGKSMSAISDPDGGFLVPPPAAVPVRKKKRRKRPVCEIVQKALLEV